jgi:hypothetical protein
MIQSILWRDDRIRRVFPGKRNVTIYELPGRKTLLFCGHLPVDQNPYLCTFLFASAAISWK